MVVQHEKKEGQTEEREDGICSLSHPIQQSKINTHTHPLEFLGLQTRGADNVENIAENNLPAGELVIWLEEGHMEENVGSLEPSKIETGEYDLGEYDLARALSLIF